uniref:DNA helicase MCM8 n=1 Tax=Culicoides sonorensis TaxID=179676 RepID=A0A336MI36_CULSO
MTGRGRGRGSRGRGTGTKRPASNPIPGPSTEGNSESTETGNVAKKPKKFNFYRRGFWGRRGNFFQRNEKRIVIHLPHSIEYDDDDYDITSTEPIVPLECFGTKEFPYFKFYFPEIEYDENSDLIKQINAFGNFFTRNISKYEPHLPEIAEKRTFTIKYRSLLKDQQFMNDFDDFVSHLKNKPYTILSAAGLAMHQIVMTKIQETRIDLEVYRPRLIGFGPIQTVVDANVPENIDTLITVRGTVMRTNGVKIRDMWQVFRCDSCGHDQLVLQENGKRMLPNSCRPGCKNRSLFDIVLKSPYRVFEPVQEICVKESIYADEARSNMMQTIDLFLKYDLVNELAPGDDVVFTGVLRVTHKPGKRVDELKEYVDCVSIAHKNNGCTVRRLDFTDKDMQSIQLIKSAPSPFRLLVNSLSTKIHGMEMIKAGLVLSLFSGMPSFTDVTRDYNQRDNVHILLVGDPGMGKSVLLTACCNVAPKAIYTVSSHLSGAGLTASVRRSKGQVTIDGGALVLAHGGVCCIDELDKKEKMHIDLLDAMERQKISIIKLGVKVNLPARTTIIAAGNPVGNIYKKSKTIAENLKINPALLNRFDLIFIIIRDTNAIPGEKLNRSFTSTQRVLSEKASAIFGAAESTLESFLEISPHEDFIPVPAVLFQNYIGYARSNCFPKMTREAADKLIEFFMELFRKQELLEFFEITTRQFQALRRLAIARARIDLSDVVTIKHVQDIIELTRYSLIDIFTTDSGELESRGPQCSGMSKSRQKMVFWEKLKKIETENGQKIFTMDQLKKIKENLQITLEIHDIIDSLNIQGYLLMIKPNVYKLVK